jgi:hypothetical protein
MRIESHKIPKDVRQGLTSLLIDSVFVRERNVSPAIITTSPSQWLPYVYGDSATFIDVTPLVGMTLWSNAQDIKDRLLERIGAAGWPDNRLVFEYVTDQASSSPSKQDRRTVESDVVVDENNKPAIVGELKFQWPLLTIHIENAKLAAKRLGVRFAFVWNGDVLIFLDSHTGVIRHLEVFPSPDELGILVPSDPYNETAAKPSVAINRCRSSNDLKRLLATLGPETIILDYTIPFGTRETKFTDVIRDLLPINTTDLRRLDPLAALLLVVGSESSAKSVTALVPQSFLSAPTLASTRQYLESRFGLAGVAQLTTGLFLPLASIAPALIVLGKTREDHQAVFSISSNRGDVIEPTNRSWFQSFRTALQGGDVGTETFVSDRAAPVDWSPARYRPEIGVAESVLDRVFDARPLSDLFEIILSSVRSREEDKRGVPLLRGRDLSSPLLTRESLTKYKVDRPISEVSKVRAQDVLLQRSGSRFQCRLADKELDGVAISDSVVILRARNDLAEPPLLLQFLRSAIGQDLLVSCAQTATVPTLRQAALRSLRVPILSPGVADDLHALERVEQDLRVKADKLASMRMSLFSASSSDELSARLKEMRQSSFAIDSSITQAESPEFQVRNFYPFPLAYPYRTLATPTVVQELYKEQLRIAENILAFLASLSLALVEVDDQANLADSLKESWQGGISPGHWRDVSQKISGLFKSENRRLPVSLRLLWSAKRRTKFATFIEELIKAKNDFKHDRGPKIDEDYAEASMTVMQVLGDVMEELSFLSEYPIRYVTDLNGVRGSRRVKVQTLRFMGDHPALPQEIVEYHEMVTKHDLYVQIEEGQWKSLFPFLTVHNCPRCKYRETYFIDRWNRSTGTAVLKSFERGHTLEDTEIAESLAKW